jgi:pimeloyl-ACP methyl ester carboxylesterase
LVGSVKLLGNLRIINKSVARFAALQLNTRPKRRLVARSWLALRAIPESPSDLADILNAFNIPLHIIAGHHDRVVPLHRMTRLSDAVSHAQITILKTGHNQLPKATIEMLVAEQNTHV